MKNVEPLDAPAYKHLYLFFYLIPIFGFFPALWTLYIFNSTPPAAEYLADLWLFYGQSLVNGETKWATVPRLPGFSRFAERVLGKHLA